MAPPELTDDLVCEILLRLPPDDPACLFRASLVCKPWCRLLTGPAFDRRYRELHRTPPLLGFLSYSTGHHDAVQWFVPTTDTSPFSTPRFDDCVFWWTHDCRHGRVLLHSEFPTRLIVWDPITDGRHYLAPPLCRCDYYAATVLCSADGCDHLSCHGGPWLVVFVVSDPFGGGITTAAVYSSETGAWGASTSIQLDGNNCVRTVRSLLTGDALYFTLGIGILRYDLAGADLSVVDVPDTYGQPEGFVVTAEDGGLGFVNMVDDSLYLWSRQAGSDGNAGWAQTRVVHLRAMLPDGASWSPFHLIGFAEGTDTIIIGNGVEIFTVKVKSGQVRKLGTKGSRYTIVPYMTFYTPARVCALDV